MKISNSRLKIFFLFLILAVTAPLFAATDLTPPGLKTLGDNVEETFRGPLVKIILTVLTIGAGIAYAYNKDNEKMKMKLLAIFIGIGIITAASWIVGEVFKAVN